MDAVFVEKQTDVTKHFTFCFVGILLTSNRSQNYFEIAGIFNFSFTQQKATTTSPKKQINKQTKRAVVNDLDDSITFELHQQV